MAEISTEQPAISRERLDQMFAAYNAHEVYEFSTSMSASQAKADIRFR
jgi:hypothetical protein